MSNHRPVLQFGNVPVPKGKGEGKGWDWDTRKLVDTCRARKQGTHFKTSIKQYTLCLKT